VFEGTFSGPNAEARVRLFDNLRLSGEIVWLTWASFRRRVIVKNFEADYHSPWWIPYHVTCTVVYQSRAVPTLLSVVGDIISSDLSNAALAVAGSAIDILALQKSLSSPNALTTGTSNQVQAIAAVNLTLGAMNLEIAKQSERLIRRPASTGNSDVQTKEFETIVESAGLLAATVTARSYVGRIGTKLTNIGN
jgi:hypothetical protein